MRNSTVLIVGDFNYPTINFQSGHCRGTEATVFYELTQELGLTEHVGHVTRWRDGYRPSRLDLALTSETNFIGKVELGPPLGASGHATINLRLVTNVEYTSTGDSQRLNFRKANFEGMRRFLSGVDWSTIELDEDVNSQWECMHAHLTCAIRLFVPLWTLRKKSFKPALTSKTKNLIHQKKLLWDKLQLQQESASYDEYKSIRNQCTTAIRNDRRRQQEVLAKDFIARSKKFFKHVATVTKSRAAVSCLVEPDGPTTSNVTAAELLREQYCSVYTTRPNTAMQRTSAAGGGYTMEPFAEPDFSASNVQRKIRQLKPDTSPGLDEIPVIMLRECVAELSSPLSQLFFRSYRSSVVPERWKLGVISPIYKGGDRTDPSNYRPVALLSLVSKLMESILDDAIRDLLGKTSIFAPEQHGSRSGRSCVTNLLTTHDSWTKAADSGKPVDVVFLDFAKAFDRVHHDILLQKCYAAGLNDIVR